MASSFIGKSISLISHSDIRYRGTLQGIDPQASTIQLENVYYMGTETRRPPEQYVPPKQDPYAFIVFRASEVKDLAVDDSSPPITTSVHDDPAVLGASPAVVPNQPSRTQQQQNRNRPNPVSSANAAVEQVERAMSDLRVNGGGNSTNRGGRGGGRRGRGGGRAGDNGGAHSDSMRVVPTTDFDFERANAKFDKTATAKAAKSSGDDSATSDDAPGLPAAFSKTAYNPKNSFFDSLSSSAAASDRGPGGGRGRRGAGPGSVGRTRRDEEREKNFVTFGETGAVGMLGRGDHVGWNGYGGRRGGSRPRRGTSRGGANTQAAIARG